MRSRLLFALAITVAACDGADPALSSEQLDLDYPAWGTCRGTCTEEVRYQTDMSGYQAPFTTYRCVDYAFSAVNPQSRIRARTACSKVAQCIADGLCDAVPAILPQQQWLVQNTNNPTNARDGYGTIWVRARVDITSPKQYFLFPEWFGHQEISTYTATTPPASPSVTAALDGKQPCPVARERVHGTATCAAQPPSDVCALRSPDTSAVISETRRCHTDPQLDVPRQWFHATGQYPQNAPQGQWNYDLDGTGCAFGIASVAGNIGGAFVSSGASLPWAFLRAGGSLLAVSRCIPSVTPPQQVDHFMPGATFPGPLSMMHSIGGQTNVDLVGEVCRRSIGYKWVHTREVKLYTWTHGIPYNSWSLADGALSNARFFSGGSIVIEGTEPCVCGTPGDPNSIGIDCTALTNKQSMHDPWRLTDNSTQVGSCDYRGCDCTPPSAPVVYTGNTLPPDPCPPGGGSGSGSGSGSGTGIDAGVDAGGGGSGIDAGVDAGGGGSGSGSGGGSGMPPVETLPGSGSGF